MLGDDLQKKVLSKRYRVSAAAVRRHLPTLCSHPLGAREFDADVAMVAGCVGVLPGLESADVDGALDQVRVLLGDDYEAGFRDGYNYNSTSKRVSRRYVEGLEDGGRVGSQFRHHRRLGTGT